LIWIGPFQTNRDKPQDARVDSTHVHQQLTVTVADEMTRATRSWLRVHFRNNGEHPITVTGATPFVGVIRGSRRSPLLPGAPAHFWPESSAVSGGADEPRLVLKPNEVRSYSIAVHYALEHLWASRDDAAGADEPIQIDYFLRVETVDARDERRMSSFRYMTRVIGNRIAGMRARSVPGPERYPAVVLREA
jgi:hypothetical protein